MTAKPPEKKKLKMNQQSGSFVVNAGGGGRREEVSGVLPFFGLNSGNRHFLMMGGLASVMQKQHDGNKKA